MLEKTLIEICKEDYYIEKEKEGGTNYHAFYTEKNRIAASSEDLLPFDKELKNLKDKLGPLHIKNQVPESLEDSEVETDNVERTYSALSPKELVQLLEYSINDGFSN